MEEEEEEEALQPAPKKQAYDGPTHPLSKDLVCLSSQELMSFAELIKANKTTVEGAGVEPQDLLNFEKTSMSVKFITIYLHEIEPQMEAFFNARPSDMNAYKKLQSIDLELSKKKSQLMSFFESGKLEPAGYLNLIDTEYSKTISLAKIAKKLKASKILKFLFAKAKIIDSEVQETKEYLKELAG